MKSEDIQKSQIIYDNLIALLGDEPATRFGVLLFEISQLFDDIYDDGGLEKKETVELIFKTMVELPQNHFYNTFKAQLQPLVTSMFLQWISANQYEIEKRGLEKAYMLRAFLFQIYQFCGMLLKGKDFAMNEALVFQDCYGEEFNEYKREIDNA